MKRVHDDVKNRIKLEKSRRRAEQKMFIIPEKPELAADNAYKYSIKKLTDRKTTRRKKQTDEREKSTFFKLNSDA